MLSREAKVLITMGQFTVLYARVSSDGQSVQMQLAVAQELIKDVPEGQLKILVDDGVSATKTKMADRKHLQELMALIVDGKVSNLIVYDRDRLARNFFEYYKIASLLQKHKVKVIFTGTNVAPFDQSMQVEGLRAIFAQQEGQTIARRRADAQKQYPVNLLGYERQKNGKVVSYKPNQHAETIVQLFEEVSMVEDANGFFKLLSDFKRRLHRQEARLLGILQTPFYTARWQREGQYFPLSHVTPIVDISLYEAAQDKLRQFHDIAYEFLVSPKVRPDVLLYCGLCGAEMKFRPARPERPASHYCATHRKVQVPADRVMSITRKVLEDKVRMLDTEALKTECIQWFSQQRRKFNVQLRKCRDELSRTAMSIVVTYGAAGGDTRTNQLLMERRHLQTELQNIESQLRDLNVIDGQIGDVTYLVSQYLQQQLLSETEFKLLSELIIRRVECFQIRSNFISISVGSLGRRVKHMTYLNADAYGRVSDRKQIANHSLETQRTTITQAAEVRGYRITNWFEDEAISAFRRTADQRPGMQALLRHVLENDVQAVFFYDESRIDRKIVEFALEIWQEIKRRKPEVKFFSAADSGLEEWDPNNPLTQYRLLQAAEDSLIKSRRATDSQRRFLQQSEPARPGSKAPYGYDQIQHTLLPNEDAPVVYFVFHMASWGYSDKKLADILTSCGVPSPSGGAWAASSIDSMLNRQAYRGNLAWNVRQSARNGARKPLHQVQLFKDVFDPIIPSNLWELVQGIRWRKKTTGIKISGGTLLDRVGTCQECGVRLQTKDQSPSGAKQKYVKYYCPACGAKMDARKLDELIRKKVSKDWIAANFDLMTKKASSVLHGWTKMLTAERQNLVRSKETAEVTIALGNLPAEVEGSFTEALTYCTQRLGEVDVLLQRIEQLQEDSDGVFGLDRYRNTVFDHLSHTEQRAFVLAVIKAVRVSFESQIRVAIDYRLSPFIELEAEIGRITESNELSMGK